MLKREVGYLQDGKQPIKCTAFHFGCIEKLQVISMLSSFSGAKIENRYRRKFAQFWAPTSIHLSPASRPEYANGNCRSSPMALAVT